MPTTYSPRRRLASAANHAEKVAHGMRSMVSNCLVNSRPSVSSRAPQDVSSSASVTMRCGASSKMTARAVVCKEAKAVALGLPFAGRKPAKTKPCVSKDSDAVSMPMALTKVVTLLAPGIGMTRSWAACTSDTKRAPGSLTPGVPASLT